MNSQLVAKNLVLGSTPYKLGISQEEEDKLNTLKIPLAVSVELNDDGTLLSVDKTYDDVVSAVNSGAAVIMDVLYTSTHVYLELMEWRVSDQEPYFTFQGEVRIGNDVVLLMFYLFRNSEMSHPHFRNFQMKDERVSSWTSAPSDENYPTEKLCWESFMRKPVVIYNDTTGFEASNDYAGDTWHLTGLDLSPYKRLKFYVSAGGDTNDNRSPQHLVEMSLDDRNLNGFGYYTACHTAQNPNNRNRLHIVTFAVDSGKTAVQFLHSVSLYGTAASNSVGGRRCFLIEGYYD